ncbi:putative Ig domain-containing protein [Cupriavidus sp. 8B]
MTFSSFFGRKAVRVICAIAIGININACGGGGSDSTSNDCSGGKNVYTDFTYANATQTFITGKPIAPQTPIAPGVPSSCWNSTNFSIAAGKLPTGLTLDSRTGVISGTPTQVGIFDYRTQMTLNGFKGSVSNGIKVDVADPASYTVTSWHKVNDNLPMTDDFRLDGMGSNLISVTAGFYSRTMDTYLSSDSGKTWNLLNISGPQPFSKEFATTSDGASLYFSGGMTDTGSFPGGIWKFDGTTWVQRTATGFPARRRHALIKMGNSLYVIGGTSPAGAHLGDVWESVDDGATWTYLGTPFSGRTNVCAVGFQGKLVVLGGTDGSHNFSEVWSSADGITWSQQALATNSPFFGGSPFLQQCAVANGRIYFSEDIGVVSTADLTNWNFEPFLLVSQNAVPGMVAQGGALYFADGEGTSSRVLYSSGP